MKDCCEKFVGTDFKICPYCGSEIIRPKTQGVTMYHEPKSEQNTFARDSGCWWGDTYQRECLKGWTTPERLFVDGDDSNILLKLLAYIMDNDMHNFTEKQLREKLEADNSMLKAQSVRKLYNRGMVEIVGENTTRVFVDTLDKFIDSTVRIYDIPDNINEMLNILFSAYFTEYNRLIEETQKLLNANKARKERMEKAKEMFNL